MSVLFFCKVAETIYNKSSRINQIRLILNYQFLVIIIGV